MAFAWPKARSIAARLYLSQALWSFAILLIAGIVLSAIHRRATIQAFDERLGVSLRALVADVANPGEETRTGPGQLGDPQFELTLSGWYWQITRLDGEKSIIRSSRSLFAARLPKLSDAGIAPGIGGSRRGTLMGPDERNLRIVERVINVGDQGIFLVQVAAATDDIEAEIARFQLTLLLTFCLLALALVASTAFQLRYGLRPLHRLQEGVAAIRRGDAEKIEGSFSQDLAPLAGEVNLLIDGNRDIVERARTQVGNLAHALKTPLSVIVNEADANAGPLSDKMREQATIMRDQVTFYLDRARAAARAGALGAFADVEPVVDGLVRTFGKINRSCDFSSEVQPGLRFQGEKQDLEEMIGNLVDNAGKWAKGAVHVEAGLLPPDGPRRFFTVTIDDDGPGLSPAQREAATKRGLRLDETKPGSGLGLSIVTDLASLYGGALRLDASPSGGLRAELRLPAV